MHALLAPLAAWLAVSSSLGTTFVNRPLSEAVEESPNIVRGKTGDSYSNWDKEHKRIFTYTNLTVTEVLKGNIKDGSSILLRSPGGEKDGMQMHVPGAAQFSPMEDVVLMLGPHNAEDDSYDIPGFATGKYTVGRGANGEAVLLNSLGAAAVYDPNKDPRSLSYNAKIPLDVFRRVAKGESVPEARKEQFKASEKEAPSNAFEAGHKHPEIRPADPGKPKPVVPSPRPSATAAPAPAEHESSSIWVPLSFLLLGVAGAAFGWFLLRSGTDKDA